jgi:hypothetical protein
MFSLLRYRVRMSDAGRADSERQRVGLCADCLHVRRVESARGSLFYRCERSASDPKFPRYPRLPVIDCEGYEQSITRQSRQGL